MTVMLLNLSKLNATAYTDGHSCSTAWDSSKDSAIASQTPFNLPTQSTEDKYIIYLYIIHIDSPRNYKLDQRYQRLRAPVFHPMASINILRNHFF